MIEDSIAEDRKKLSYRLLESALGIATILFLLAMIILSILDPILASILLIVYSFFWVLKYSLNAIYTIYTYKELRRWEKFDWDLVKTNFDSKSFDKIDLQLSKFQSQFNTLDWSKKIQIDRDNIKSLVGSDFENPFELYHVAIFSIYNESIDVIKKSLINIFESKYSLDKVMVVITQEERIGKVHIEDLIDEINQIDWINFNTLQENDLETVYNSNFENLKYFNKDFSKIKLKSDKLNLFFTRHPDGLIGEIKGKASNEDWGARQASLVVKSKEIPSNKVLVTSLDADSHVGEYFFHNLSYRYALCQNKDNVGFQPIHVYSNNFFETGFFQRQVATTNTLTNMMYLTITDETHFFAIYSTPLHTLQKVNFWVREVIGEDYMLYAKCLAYFKGDFNVVSFYGVFEGDAVEADDYLEAIINQYKQLQRWTWGGVESFPYIFKKFFMEEHTKSVPITKKINYVSRLFNEHFFWASTPLTLSVGMILPQLFNGEQFGQEPIAQSLAVFSQYFVWISFVFVIVFGYITFRYISYKANKNQRATWYQNLLITSQFILMPFIFGLMAIPAIDSQIRGIRGKYLGYWVTPKK
jgi:hypothetical protein